LAVAPNLTSKKKNAAFSSIFPGISEKSYLFPAFEMLGFFFRKTATSRLSKAWGNPVFDGNMITQGVPTCEIIWSQLQGLVEEKHTHAPQKPWHTIPNKNRS